MTGTLAPQELEKQLRTEIATLQAQLEVISEMYDRVHAERDRLRAAAEHAGKVAVELQADKTRLTAALAQAEQERYEWKERCHANAQAERERDIAAMREQHMSDRLKRREDELAAVREQLRRTREAVQAIADGNWNFGNAEPGLTVSQYARRALGGEGEQITTKEDENG